jgi:hypothetical protein
MKPRTLITHRLYFGMDALKLRQGSGRVATRIVGLPPERARVSARHLWQDFGVDSSEGRALVEVFVAHGLLQAQGERKDDYFLTERFLEFAAARVVEPLLRPKAKLLLAEAGTLAERINADWTHNPYEIELVAPFGSYMSRDEQLAELNLGIVVRPRDAARRTRWRRMASNAEGASEMRAAFRKLSSFVDVEVVKDRQRLPRPFAVVFQQR